VVIIKAIAAAITPKVAAVDENSRDGY